MNGRICWLCVLTWGLCGLFWVGVFYVFALVSVGQP